jgi:hypothetical protein
MATLGNVIARWRKEETNDEGDTIVREWALRELPRSGKVGLVKRLKVGSYNYGWNAVKVRPQFQHMIDHRDTDAITTALARSGYSRVATERRA